MVRVRLVVGLAVLVLHLPVLVLLEVLLGGPDTVGHGLQRAVSLSDLELEGGDALLDLANLALDVLRVGQRRHLRVW